MSHKNVHAAKIAVMTEVGYCRKQKAQGLNYSFAGEAALIEALRPAMVDAGLVLAPTKAEILKDEPYTTGKGSVMHWVKTRHTFRLTHADSETFEDIEVLGEASDSGDKSIPKSQTIAFKYALRQAFIIETGDDPDKYASEEEAAPPFFQRSQAPPPPSTNGHANGKTQPTEHWRHFRADCDNLIREFPNIYPDWNAVCEHAKFVLRSKTPPINPDYFPDWFATKADGDKLTRMMEALELRTQTAPEVLPIGEIPF